MKPKVMIPSYFDEKHLDKEMLELINAEKALQKAQRERNNIVQKQLQDTCVKGWQKYLDTPKMQAGRKMYESQHRLCLYNLRRIGVHKNG